MKYAYLSVIAVVFTHQIIFCQGIDYCQKQLGCGDVKHFMCEFKKNANTEKCSRINSQISEEQRKLILKMVNEFRNNIASGEDPAFQDGAKDERQVSWDHEMETFAEVYGSQCGGKTVPELDPCAKAEGFPNGTRVLWGLVNKPSGEVSESDLEDIIVGPEGWISQVPNDEVIKSFEPVEGEDRSAPNYGRFTMLAWAPTHKMGCSIISCDCSPKLATYRKLVCFLGPGGNNAGQPVFLSGSACSSCPEGTSCRSSSVWPNLCAAEDDPTSYSGLSRGNSIYSVNVEHLVFLITILMFTRYR